MSPTKGAAEALENAAAPPLAQLLETEGQVKMLDIFLTRDSLWITADRLAEYAAINQSTVSRNISTLQQADLVETRGNHPTEYRLNAGNEAAQYLRDVHSVLADRTQDIQAMFGDDSEIDIGDMTSGSPFVLLFSKPTRVALLDALLSRDTLWANRERLADLIDVDPTTVKRHIDPLQEVGLIEKREGSWPYEYRLTQGQDVVTALKDAHLKLSDYTVDLQKITQPRPADRTYPEDRTTVAQAVQESLADLEVSLGTASTDDNDRKSVHDLIKRITDKNENAADPTAHQEQSAKDTNPLVGDDHEKPTGETDSVATTRYDRSGNTVAYGSRSGTAQAA